MARGRHRRTERHGSFERDVYEAIRSAGWLFPETEDEIRAAEEEMNQETVEIPERLTDPFAALERGANPKAVPSAEPPFPSQELEDAFARAAREGTGTIPEDVEERMRRDREQAESEADEENREH